MRRVRAQPPLRTKNPMGTYDVPRRWRACVRSRTKPCTLWEDYQNVQMKVVVFVTDNRVGELKPTLFLPDYPPAAIPPHPAGRVWRYLATVDHQDALLDADRADI